MSLPKFKWHLVVKGFLIKRKQFILILLLYFFLCYLYYYFFLASKWVSTRDYLNKIGDGFAVSFSASLLDDLIIFLALTLVVTFLTTKSLAKYTYHEKIRAIINSKNSESKEGVYNFIYSRLSKLLAYDKLREFQIVIADYDEAAMAYKLFFEQRYVIANICSDKDYKKKDYHFFVMPADIVRNECGAVTFLEERNSAKKLQRTIIDEATAFKLDKKFEKNVELSVSKNGETEIFIKFHVWSITSSDFDPKDLPFWNFIRFERYGEKTKLNIVNQLDRKVKFDVYANQIEKNTLDLYNNDTLNSHGGKSEFTMDLELYPGDDVRIFFHKQ